MKEHIVMTLDAGGTNLVFSAMQGGKEITEPIKLPTITDDLEACLASLRSGFEQVRDSLEKAPSAISFAFPGPADYEAGIIGDLPNFPAFRGGVPLGPYLEECFGIPVFINNDGNLFAYGEALGGMLPLPRASAGRSSQTPAATVFFPPKMDLNAAALKTGSRRQAAKRVTPSARVVPPRSRTTTWNRCTPA